MPFLTCPSATSTTRLTGDGPALVFVYGLGGSHLSWWQQAPYARDRITCVTFAPRGFGSSREAAGGPGPGAFADDLAALMSHLELPDVGLVAPSMGG
jgi:pimeloyl-ACP methyl ester carboxylesterase